MEKMVEKMKKHFIIVIIPIDFSVIVGL